MQLPTVMSRGAERQLKRQRGTQSRRSTDSGGGDGARCAPLRVSSTMQVPTVTSQGAERRLKRQRDTRGDYGDGVEHASEGEQHDAAAHLEHASEGEQHDAAAHPDEPRSDECIEERAQE